MAQDLNSALAGLLAAGAALVGWFAGRTRRRGVVGQGTGAHLLPDPALDWLRRAHGAYGVWVSELDAEAQEPRAERIVDAERLTVAQISAVDRRLERARDTEQEGVERMDGGVLAFRGEGGVAVGILLPPGTEVSRLQSAAADLRRLLEGVKRRPQFLALSQAQSHEATLESAGSVGLRLAYQLERALDAEVVVVAREAAGPRVVGVSGRADRRLLDTVLPAESELGRIATGMADEIVSTGDALGGVMEDRRHPLAPAVLLPLRLSHETVGAVSVRMATGQEPSGAARRELVEALAGAAPRLARAIEADRRRHAMTADPLTTLLNRRGLDEVLERVGSKAGSLVYADLDRFKLLNDTLGHPAGDAALVHFARLIREQIRAGDVAARVGGEEFAVWLPGAELGVGVRIAERMRIKLGTTPWDWRGRSWPLSASFGVAACPETSRSVENLPAQADAALYVAKNSGRNRVERAGGPFAHLPA